MLYARWLSHLLNADQKQMCKQHLQQCLDRFKKNSTSFVRRCHHGWDLGPPLNARNQTSIEAVCGIRWFSAKESKVNHICRKDHAQCVLGCQRDTVNWLPWKRQQLQANMTFLTSWMSKFARRGQAWRRRRRKSSFIKTMHLLTKVCWQWENCGIWGTICLASSDFHLLPNLKKFVCGKRFASNEEVERT